MTGPARDVGGAATEAMVAVRLANAIECWSNDGRLVTEAEAQAMLDAAQPDAEALREEVERLRAAEDLHARELALIAETLAASERALAGTRAELRRVEWVKEPMSWAKCPCCGQFQPGQHDTFLDYHTNEPRQGLPKVPAGHAPGCALAVALDPDPGPGTAGAGTGGGDGEI